MSRARRAAWVALLIAGPAAASRAATLQPTEPPEMANPPFELHPHLGLAESYDSNILLQPNPTRSWVSTIDGGIYVPMQIAGSHRLDLSYDAADRSYSYVKDPSLRNAPIQSAEGRYWYETPWGLKTRARENFLNTIDPASSELTGLRRRWANLAGLELGYEPEGRRLLLTLDGQQTRQKYVSEDAVLRQSLDRYDQLFGVKAGWQLQPRTVLFAQYHRQIIHFTDHPSEDRNSKGHLVDFGVEGELADKLSGRAQVGFVGRQYDGAPAPGASRVANDVTSLASLTYRPLERSRAVLAWSRSLEESAYDVNEYYVANAANLTLAHDLPWGLQASATGGVEFDRYPIAVTTPFGLVQRRDDNYFAGLGLDYLIREWLKASASYSYRVRHSHGLDDLFGIHDQITMISLTLQK